MTQTATARRPVAPDDPEWPRPDPDQLWRRFGPNDWARFVAQITDGCVQYTKEMQSCPCCGTGTERATFRLALPRGTHPPRFACERCHRSGDILALIALVSDLRLDPNVDAFDTLWRWADAEGLPEVYKPPAKETKPARADLLSARRLLQREPDLQGIVSFDLFRNEVMLERPIPRPDYGLPEHWTPRPLTDEDVTALTEILLDRNLLCASSSLMHEVLRGIARDISKHPVQTYLRSLEWDGIERLSTWLTDYASAILIDPDDPLSEDRKSYVEAVARASLIGAVARVMQPGCKHDHVLTLIGRQGILKSKLLAALVPDETWFSDSLTHDMGNKDAMVGLAGTWICEMAELAALNKTDFALAKAFLSRQVDKFRPPFGRLDIRLPRQVAFFATTNVDSPFKDETGNRRYWPLGCGRIENGRKILLDPDGLAAVRDQIWAEAVAAYDSGERWWLSPHLEALARREQDQRHAEHPLASRVQKTLQTLSIPFQIDEILTAWGVRDSDWTRMSMDVAKALGSLGYAKRKRRLNGREPLWWWEPKPTPGQSFEL